MRITGNSLFLLASFGFGIAGVASGSDELPAKLTPETYDTLRELIEPTAADLAWQQTPWRDGFFDGLVVAQERDKPLFYWIYEGDPRANC